MALCVALDANGVAKFPVDINPLLREMLAAPASRGGYAAMEGTVSCAHASVFRYVEHVCRPQGANNITESFHTPSPRLWDDTA